jgi:tetratricopeptide (TPR) repeat protein
MDENLPLEDQLMSYLDNEMSPEERQLFEVQLKSNPDLQKRLERLTLAQKAVQYYGIETRVKEVRRQFQNEAPVSEDAYGKVVKMRRPVRALFIAAASTIIIAAGVVAYMLYELSPEKTYSENYIAYNIPVARGNDSSITSIEKAYQEKKYAQVIELSRNGVDDSRQKFLLGLSYMQVNDFPKAIEQLKELAAAPSKYKPDAEFYLGLSYLRIKQYDAALEILGRIKDDASHVYHDQVSGKMISEIKWLKWKG